MHTTESSRITITPHQLYRKLVTKISSTQQPYRQRIKRTISHKYEKHISLLQSHRNKELKFQRNFVLMQKTQEDKNKQLRLAFLQKQRKIRQSKDNFITEKKKKMENSFNRWQSVVSQSKQKYMNELQESDNQIRKWNGKCEESISKKKERLNTISSSLNSRSRISSAKSIKHKEKQLQQLLQKALLNPQKSSTKQKDSRAKMFSNNSQSRMLSSRSRVTTAGKQGLAEKSQQQVLQKHLEQYVKKQAHIRQVRNKKTQLFNQVKKIRQDKSFQIGQMHKQNNYYLSNKREQMQAKLDSKFMQNRKKNIETNRSLPAIYTKANLSLIYGPNKKLNQECKTDNKRTNRTTTIQPKYDRMIMDELRNIGLATKMIQGKR